MLQTEIGLSIEKNKIMWRSWSLIHITTINYQYLLSDLLLIMWRSIVKSFALFSRKEKKNSNELSIVNLFFI